MATRLKVKCTSVTEYEGYDHVAQKNTKVKNIALTPVASGSEENKAFFAATPGGRLEFNVTRLEAVADFEVGKEFYVDITPA